jgi:hypothetical protein
LSGLSESEQGRPVEQIAADLQSRLDRGYTPSDFPLAKLNQQALDMILAQVRKAQG